jgi:hypothetical protein
MALISNGSTVFDAGSMASGFGGSMTFIKKLTASSSATLSFVDGSDGVVLDNSFKEYVFTFKDIHPSSDGQQFLFNGSDDTSSHSYDIVKTTTSFEAHHNEADNNTSLGYNTGGDLAQSTAFQMIGSGTGTDNDQCMAGTLHLYNPSSTTFVKHFMSTFNCYTDNDFTREDFTAGYFNTTAAITALQFKFGSGNIDAGDICLYGIA